MEGRGHLRGHLRGVGLVDDECANEWGPSFFSGLAIFILFYFG